MKKIDLIFILLLIATLLVFWLPTIDTPYWWDSAGYVVHTARQFLETNFNPLVPSDEYTDFAHPPFFVTTLAASWKIFGESLFISHLVNFIFAFLALLYTYLLGKELIKDKITGSLIGFFAGILLLITPVFLAQLGIIYVEIPVAAFAVMTVYYAFKKNLLGYLVSATLMILTKEMAIFIILIILAGIFLAKIYQWLKEKEKLNLTELAKTIFLWSIPLFILFLWFLYHKIIAGWWLVIPGRELGGEVVISFNKIRAVLKFLFLEQWRWILTFFIVFSGFFMVSKRDLRENLLNFKILLIILILLGAALIFGLTEFLHRYIILGLPFFFLLFFYCLALFFLTKSVKKQVGIFLGITLILFLFFATSWDDHRKIKSWHFPPLEENLEYLDVIDVGKEMASFVEENYPEAVVYTGFPSHYMLGEPFQHYIPKPIEVYDCRYYKEGDRVDLIVFHFLSPSEINCLQLIKKLGLTPLKVFEKNGKKMEIYKNPNL